MSEQKFTKGPWEYIATPGAEVIAGMFRIRHHWSGGAKPTEMHANARLIAASPDLLAACQRLLNDAPKHSLSAEFARRAIAKATGG